MRDRREALAFLQGFLFALEAANTFTNNGSSFALDELLGSDLLAGLRQLMPTSGVASVSAEELTDWRTELRSAAPIWFGAGIGAEGLRLISDRLVELLVDLLATPEPTVHRVRIGFEQGAPFYEASWEDLVFSGKGGTYLLHLAVSD
ncbi:MAG: hypothetical protein AB7N76_13560 [Planctomycetota bacterium]